MTAYCLYDTVRVLTRLVGSMGELAPEACQVFPRRTRRAKRRMQEIGRMRERVQRRRTLALNEVRFDYALLAEPIASWHAPVIGPHTYQRHALPGLRRVIERLRTAGIEILILETHGAVKPIIPLVLEAGVNTLWIGSARAAHVDYLELRLIGGLDVRALEKDKATVERERERERERELMSLAPTLLEQGGYIPMVDERIRSYISFENYAYYRELIRRLAEGG